MVGAVDEVATDDGAGGCRGCGPPRDRPADGAERTTAEELTESGRLNDGRERADRDEPAREDERAPVADHDGLAELRADERREGDGAGACGCPGESRDGPRGGRAR